MGAGRTMEMVFAIKGIMDTAFSSSTKTAAQNLRQMKSEASRLKDAIKETEQAQKNLDKAFKAGGMSEGSYKKALADMKESLKGYNTELAKAAQNQAAQAKQALQIAGAVASAICLARLREPLWRWLLWWLRSRKRWEPP